MCGGSIKPIPVKARGKFKVESKTETACGTSIEMRPVTSGSEENKAFYKYTPSGSLSLQVLNDNVVGKFVVGKEYYIDITAAE